MSDPNRSGTVRKIDQLCDRFEADWRSGRRPTIEAYLTAAGEPLATNLLRELLGLELECRIRAGEKPTLAEYQQRFPSHVAFVLAAFGKPVPAVPLPPNVAPQPETAVAGLTLAAIEGPSKGQVFTFGAHEFFLVGRSKQAHLHLNDSFFSRLHFMVEINPPQCRLTDLGSRNGTFLNGQRVQPSALLKEGDLIKAGHTTLRVSLSGMETMPAGGSDRTEVQTLDLPGDGPVNAAPVLQDVTQFGPGPSGLIPPPTQPAPAEPMPTIRGYRLVKELGRGGMGVVYLGVRDADGYQVALKTIVPAVAAHPSQVKRFLREAEILCQLQHEHIVAFREVGESDGRLFFAMDYVPGTDAARMVKQKGPLPVRTATRMIYQLLSALDYAHGKGFVHRDIKPANLLVADDGSSKAVKLADFGLARVYQESRLSGLTMQGDVGGTMAFMPPEQITHFRHVKPAADQYSVGATLYNLLTGCVPFDFAAKALPPLTVVLQEDPEPIRKYRPDLSEELAAIITRMMSKDPQARFPDVRTVKEKLKPFVT